MPAFHGTKPANGGERKSWFTGKQQSSDHSNSKTMPSKPDKKPNNYTAFTQITANDDPLKRQNATERLSLKISFPKILWRDVEVNRTVPPPRHAGGWAKTRAGPMPRPPIDQANRPASSTLRALATAHDRPKSPMIAVHERSLMDNKPRNGPVSLIWPVSPRIESLVSLQTARGEGDDSRFLAPSGPEHGVYKR